MLAGYINTLLGTWSFSWSIYLVTQQNVNYFEQELSAHWHWWCNSKGYRVFIELFRFFTGNGIVTNDIDCALKINPTACDMMRDWNKTPYRPLDGKVELLVSWRAFWWNFALRRLCQKSFAIMCRTDTFRYFTHQAAR